MQALGCVVRCIFAAHLAAASSSALAQVDWSAVYSSIGCINERTPSKPSRPPLLDPLVVPPVVKFDPKTFSVPSAPSFSGGYLAPSRPSFDLGRSIGTAPTTISKYTFPEALDKPGIKIPGSKYILAEELFDKPGVNDPIFIEKSVKTANPCPPAKSKEPPKKKDLHTQENRRGDPDVLEGTNFGTKFQKDYGFLMGGTAQSKKCIGAIRGLAKVNLANSQVGRRSAYEPQQIAAEDLFSTECLSKSLPNVPATVGVLSLDGLVLCTGVMVFQNFVLTSRHCLFEEELGNQRRVWMEKDSPAMTWQFWSGESQSAAYRQKRVLLPIGREQTWVPFEIKDTQQEVDIPEQFWSRDFALVEMDRVTSVPITVKPAEPQVGDVLVPISAYGPAWGQSKGDEKISPLRTQIAGTCKVFAVDKKTGCIVHGCAMAGGASGAPLFKLDPDTSNHVLVGFHESGTATGTGCSTSGWGNAVNVGLTSTFVLSPLFEKTPK